MAECPIAEKLLSSSPVAPTRKNFNAALRELYHTTVMDAVVKNGIIAAGIQAFMEKGWDRPSPESKALTKWIVDRFMDNPGNKSRPIVVRKLRKMITGMMRERGDL